MQGKVKAAFLDRDGVINIDAGYVHRWEYFHFFPGTIDAMRQLHDAGYAIIIVSNQSGIARGYFSEADYRVLTDRIFRFLYKRNVPITASYHCPHHPEGVIERYSFRCACRKPAPGMLLRAATDHRIEMSRSILIGDKASDLNAAEAAGVGSYYQILRAESEPRDTFCHGKFESLTDCVQKIVAGKRRKTCVF